MVNVTEKLSTVSYGGSVVHPPELEGSSNDSCTHHLVVGLLQHALHWTFLKDHLKPKLV